MIKSNNSLNTNIINAHNPNQYKDESFDVNLDENSNKKILSVLKKPESIEKIYVSRVNNDKKIEIQRVKRETNIELKRVIFYLHLKYLKKNIL